MKNLFYIFLTFFLLSCSYNISGIDVGKFEESCVRDCRESYTLCISQGEEISIRTEILRACRETYEACVNTCPAKK